MSSKVERKRRKNGLNKNEESELERLEKLLFDKGRSILEDAEESGAESCKKEELLSEDSIVTDQVGSWSCTPVKKAYKPAWDDPDDRILSVGEALAAQGRPNMGVPGKPTDDYQTVMKKRFESRVGNPDWAKLDRKTENDDEELLKHCGNLIDNGKILTNLPRNILDIKKLHELNKSGPQKEGPYINSVQFHAKSTVALVAGSSGVASIYQVDGLANPHLQSVRFEHFPVRCARFSADGDQFIVGSQHHTHYFVYDMIEGRMIKVPVHHATEQTNMKKFEVSPDGKLIAVCGKFGNIHLLQARSKEWVGSLKMNGEVLAICFNSSGSQLFSHGDTGEVYVWDTASRKCLHRFMDEGCLAGTSIAVSSSGQLVACGSRSGVVNVYETQTAMQSSQPQPKKALLHLVTSASSLQFDSSSQILAMASDAKEGAFKLVHLPSVTVFSNFPAKDSLLGRVVSHDFSPGSGYLATGNSLHRVQLFRLKHFGNY